MPSLVRWPTPQPPLLVGPTAQIVKPPPPIPDPVVGGTEITTAAEDWTGSDGAAWDAGRWATANGGTIDIQSNEGRMVSPSSPFASNDARALTGALTDYEILVRFRYTQLPNADLWVIIRGDTSAATYANGYMLAINQGGAGDQMLYKRVATANTLLGSVNTLTLVADTWYWVRLRAEGTTISAKLWQRGTTEPAGWGFQATSQTDVASGVPRFRPGSDGTPTACDVRLDHFRVGSLALAHAQTITDPVGITDDHARDLTRTITDPVGVTDAVVPAPRQISGLRLWLDNPDTLGLADGAAASAWTDISGLANNGGQATGTKQPVYRASASLPAAINGRGAFQFDGADDNFSITNADFLAATNAASGITVLAVAYSTSPDINNHDFLGIGITGTTHRFLAGVRGNPQKWALAGRRLDGDTLTALLGLTTVTAGWRLVAVTVDWANSDAFVYLNQTLDNSTTTFLADGTTSATNAGSAAVGSGCNGTLEFWHGYLAEVLVYDRALTATERQQVSDYLEVKYALGAGGTSHAQTITDPIGLVDSAAQQTDSARPLTDSLLLADAGASRDFTTVATDPLGITDTTAQDASGTLARTITDPLGLTDAASWIVTAAQTITDPVELRDIGIGSDIAHTLTDPVGLADAATQQISGTGTATFNDPLGITDPIAPAATYTRAVTDPVGVTDSHTRDLTRALTDPVGITDAVSRVQPVAQTIIDPVGILDSQAVDAAGQLSRTITDPVGIGDPRTVEQTTSRAYTDPIGSTDAATRLLAAAPEITDPLGLADPATQTSATQRATTDPVGLADSRLVDQTGPSDRTLTDPVGITDTVTYLVVDVTPRWVEHTATASGAVELVGVASGIVEGTSSL